MTVGSHVNKYRYWFPSKDWYRLTRPTYIPDLLYDAIHDSPYSSSFEPMKDTRGGGVGGQMLSLMAASFQNIKRMRFITKGAPRDLSYELWCTENDAPISIMRCVDFHALHRTIDHDCLVSKTIGCLYLLQLWCSLHTTPRFCLITREIIVASRSIILELQIFIFKY